MQNQLKKTSVLQLEIKTGLCVYPALNAGKYSGALQRSQNMGRKRG